MSVTDDVDKEQLLNENDDVGNDVQNDDKLNMTPLNRCHCSASSDGVIVGIWAVVAAAVYAVLWVAQGVLSDGTDDDYWLSDLTLNLLGYSTVFLPGYAVIRSVLFPVTLYMMISCSFE